MTRRTIRTITGANHSAKIQYDPEYREYRVTVLDPGRTVGPEESAYYTDDKGDAIATAEAMLLSADIWAQKARDKFDALAGAAHLTQSYLGE